VGLRDFMSANHRLESDAIVAYRRRCRVSSARAEFAAEATRAYLRDLRRMSLDEGKKELSRK